MQRTPEGPRPEQPSEPSPTSSSGARRSAAALAALAVLGASGFAGAPAAQAVEASPHERPHAIDGPSRTVQPGDSLWSIAAANGLPVEDLMQWNDLRGDAAIAPGDQLRLSAPAESSGASESSAASEQDQDDAASVADPVTARTAEARSTGGAVDHDAAETPSSPAPAVEHRLVAGDTLWDLSLRYEVTVDALLTANSLDLAAPLTPGRTLEIPVRRSTETAADQAPSSSSSSSSSASAERDASGPDEVTNDFPGYSYPPETVAAANRHLEELAVRPALSPVQLQEMIRRTAESLDVDPALALAHAEQESSFNHQSVSPADAVGVMQVIPAAGDWASAVHGAELDLLDPQDNVTAGVVIIRENLRLTSSREEAIGAYYQGAYGVSEYGMHSDTKRYVQQVAERAQSWRSVR